MGKREDEEENGGKGEKGKKEMQKRDVKLRVQAFYFDSLCHERELERMLTRADVANAV